jgi:hypothetical protein
MMAALVLWSAECRSIVAAFEDRGLGVSCGIGFVVASFVKLLFFYFCLVIASSLLIHAIFMSLAFKKTSKNNTLS